MSRANEDRPRWRPTPTGIVATVLIVAGSVLAATVDMSFLALFAAGVFGPGTLRELGLLRDHDELQRQAAREAAYRAYLVAGATATLMVAVMRRGTVSIEGAALAVTTVLLLLVVAFFLASLLAYWGAQRAVSRTLIVLGAFWLTFVVLSHLTEPVAVLRESLVAAPFFLLAWTALRWPRVTGVLLLAAAGFSFFFFDMHRAFTNRPGSGVAIVLMFLPLAASGIALLREQRESAMG